jgi:uncharacterized membrane-anchored protein
MNKKILIFALAFPLAVFIGITIYKHAKVTMGQEIILPVSGFDPRNILSGHYLIYRIDYGITNDTECGDWESNRKAYVCLNKDSDKPDSYRSSIFAYNTDDDIIAGECTAIIKGRCERGRFTAGIEKFYIPEERAQFLDRAVRSGQGKIVLSVTRGGSAAVKDLLIDGKSWKKYKIKDTSD